MALSISPSEFSHNQSFIISSYALSFTCVASYCALVSKSTPISLANFQVFVRLIILCGTQIPRLDDKALCRIHVVLVLDLLDAHAQAILGEDDVLLAHALRRRLGHLADTQVDLVADPGADADDGEDDYEGEDLAGRGEYEQGSRWRLGEGRGGT